MQNFNLRVAFLTLGCKVNYYETEKMIAQFSAYGCDIVEFGEEADINIINTCTVTNIADRKSRQMIHKAKRKNPDSLVVAVGCYVESAGEKAIDDDECIDLAFSNKDKDNLPEYVMEHYGKKVADCEKISSFKFSKERTRAYLKIQDGCNQFCSYCMIPYVRGKGELKSMPEEEILSQVKLLAEDGFKEVVLTGIHLSSYGIDRSKEINFVKLEGRPLLDIIEKVANIDGIERIRLGSLEPRIITKSFLEKLCKIEKFCPHFHLSLQSGCDSVLKRMNRHYTAAEYKEKVDLIRTYFEYPAITTDVIVGFPGESDNEFEITRRFLESIKMADMHIFKYSMRNGTKAADMPDQISPDTKHRRSEILIMNAKVYRDMYLDNFVNTKQKVLFEEYVDLDNEQYIVGYTQRYVRVMIEKKVADENGFKPNTIGEILCEKKMLS